MPAAYPTRRQLLTALITASTAAACSDGEARSSSASSPSNASGESKQPKITTSTSTTSTAPVQRFGPGDRPNPAKPEGVDHLPQVQHIVIYMQENQSYDGHFGMLGRGDGFTMDGSGRPTNSNLDTAGTAITVVRAPGTCDIDGGGQNWNSTHKQINGGRMDGFARETPDAMRYFDRGDMPFYYDLASTFVLCDRWFASAPAQTHPNRRYLQAGTSVGVIKTDTGKILQHPEAPNGTIWDQLNAHGISWVDYAYDLPDVLLFPRVFNENRDKIRSTSNFLADCASGNLPSVSIVSPGDKQFTEETDDVARGEAFTAMIVNAVMSGPQWANTVLFFTHDEHGGFYDHVAPPKAIPPDDIPPDIGPGDEPGGFDMYGIRVPSIVISPFAKADYVSSVVHDHTSVLKFIETKWNLPALTFRDANASDFMDCFDFDAPAFATPPQLAAPLLTDGQSRCKPGGPPLPTLS
jgi:phospholipase C